jgi:hypothetical protein
VIAPPGGIHAVEAHRREVFLEAAGFAALRDDPEAWAEDQAARRGALGRRAPPRAG